MRLPKESKEELAQDEKMWELLKPWGFTMVCTISLASD